MRAREAFAPPPWLLPRHPVMEDTMADGDDTPEWRPVPGFPNYLVSSDGKVLSLKRRGAPGGIRKTFDHGSGHLHVVLLNGSHNDRHGFMVHHLVLEAFVGPRPQGMECRHLDGNPANNVVSNLAWGTRSENQLDRVSHGTHHEANKTHCPHGHLYDEQNTRHRNGKRHCMTCQRKATRESMKRLKLRRKKVMRQETPQ